MGRRSDIDWGLIEADFRSTSMTLDAIADRHGVSKAAISKRAAANEWTRSMTRVVKVKREMALATVKEAAEGNKETNKETKKQKGERTPEEREAVFEAAIDAVVADQVGVIRAHQNIANRIRNLGDRLTAELEAVSNADPVEVKTLILAVGQEDPAGAKALAKVFALPSRIQTYKILADGFRIATEMERKAHGIDGAEEGGEYDLGKRVRELSAEPPAIEGEFSRG